MTPYLLETTRFWAFTPILCQVLQLFKTPFHSTPQPSWSGRPPSSGTPQASFLQPAALAQLEASALAQMGDRKKRVMRPNLRDASNRYGFAWPYYMIQHNIIQHCSLSQIFWMLYVAKDLPGTLGRPSGPVMKACIKNILHERCGDNHAISLETWSPRIRLLL